MYYEPDTLIRVAKRENNTKRSYLYVNPLQGKHIPVSPSRATAVFTDLAHLLEEQYPEEKILVIGFAETATAIGMTVAEKAKNVRWCMTTTREPGLGDYLNFTESHSHATNQSLATAGLSEVLARADRVVFAEDEVTTGNTIVKLINNLRAAYPSYRGAFGILSLLNSMPEERIEELREDGILCQFLCRIPQMYHTDTIDGYTYSGPSVYHEPAPDFFPVNTLPELEQYWEPRTVHEAEDAMERVKRFVDWILSRTEITPEMKKIRILGTEECMYPGLRLGRAIEERFPEAEVLFHATTRSPIMTSLDEGYPLWQRHTLDSLYEAGRTTYIYNLSPADLVLIVTDAVNLNETGLLSLVEALRETGSGNIHCFRWQKTPLSVETISEIEVAAVPGFVPAAV